MVKHFVIIVCLFLCIFIQRSSAKPQTKTSNDDDFGKFSYTHKDIGINKLASVNLLWIHTAVLCFPIYGNSTFLL